MPTKFINSEYGERLKDFIKEQKFLKKLIDFSDLQIFEDATTYTGIFIFTKINNKEFEYQKIKSDINQLFNNTNSIKIDYTNLLNKNWVFLNDNSTLLYEKLSKVTKLKDFNVSIFVGLQTSADPVYILEVSGDKLYSKFTGKYYSFSECDIIKPLLKGAEIGRYINPCPKNILIFPYKYSSSSSLELISPIEMEQMYTDVWNYLNECKDRLQSRENGRMNNNKWYGYVYLKNMTEFSKPKILTQVLCKESSLTLDLSGKFYFVGGGTAGGYGIELNNSIDPYTLISILNSKLIQWFIQKYASPFKGGFYAYNKNTLGEVPIISKVSLFNFKDLVDKIYSTNNDIQNLSNKFKLTLQRKLNLEKLPSKLEDWYFMTFKEFATELNKMKISLTLSEEIGWEDYFKAETTKILNLKAQISNCDKEINQMIYKLYELSDDEVKIIEASDR